MGYNILNQADLFARISQRIPTDSNAHPPFTLILGSGFSYGVIPTTAQIIQKDLPWWMWCQRGDSGGPMREEFFRTNESRDDDTAKTEAKAFWQRVYSAHLGTWKEKFELSSTDGLPTRESLGAAYRYALSVQCGPGLNTPRDVRRYFGDIIRRAGTRLNPAHLYLAAIIAEKRTRRLFGTIFTTNFDPLLQRSLQLVNAPFFVSDRPETLQYPDDDDVADAVHIIHAHGSIYRYLLLNSPEEIERFAVTNQNKLQEYFRKHAVLIVGSSGWDDAITRALKSVEQFDLNLYWCDRGGKPDESSLTSDARHILSKHSNAFYVPIKDADDLMVQLHQHLIGHTLPRIFREPILAARDQLDLCDLGGVRLPRTVNPSTTGAIDEKVSGSSGSTDELDLGDEVGRVRDQLIAAEDCFNGKTSKDPAARLAAQVRQRLSVAVDLSFSGKYAEAVTHFDFALKNAKMLAPGEQAQAQFYRAYAYSQRGLPGDLELEIADYAAVIEMQDASPELRARAHINRGLAYSQRGHLGDVDLEIAEYDAVIKMSGAPAEQVAKARINRGLTYGQRGQVEDIELEIADYTAVLAMPDAPPAQRSKAHLNRGVTYGQRGQAGDMDLELADYNAVIEMPDAPLAQRVRAQFNRGVAYEKRGNEGDIKLAIDDFTAIIEMNDAPVDERAMSLINRGVIYRKRGRKGDIDRAIADYSAVIDMHDASIEHRTTAQVNRGLAYKQRGQPGDPKLAIFDFDAVAGMSGAPASERERAQKHLDRIRFA